MKRNMNLSDKVFDFAYHEAMLDATMQKAYEGEKVIIEKNENVRAYVKLYVDSIFNGELLDLYDIAQKINAEIAETEFKFGNIQKLINMTVKYMYIACYADEKLRIKFAKCHCPMDSIMMKIVKEEYLKHNGGNRNDKLLMIPIGPEKSSIDLSKTAWSKMEFDYYDGPYSRIVYDNFVAPLSA